MAPKRKSAAPTRVDEGKRQMMAWNMFDEPTDELSIGIDVIVDDTVPISDDLFYPDGLVDLASTSVDLPRSSPHPPDEGKRQMMAWNMSDEPTDELSIGIDVMVDNSTSVDLPQAPPNPPEAAHVLQGFIDNCHIREPAHAKVPAKHDEWHCKLGEFKLLITGAHPEFSDKLRQSSQIFQKCWLHVDLDLGNHVVHFDNDESRKMGESNLYVTCVTEVPSSCLMILRSPAICLVLRGFSENPTALTLCLHLLPGRKIKGIKNPKFRRNHSDHFDFNQALREVMRYFYNIPIPGKKKSLNFFLNNIIMSSKMEYHGEMIF